MTRPRRPGRWIIDPVALFPISGLAVLFWIGWQVGRWEVLLPFSSVVWGSGIIVLVVRQIDRRGFRRCHAPYCRVSRTRVVWPAEYRIAVPVWGRVHLACRPTPKQLAMLRMQAGIGRMLRQFRVLTITTQQAAAQLGRLPLANPGRINQHNTDRPEG